MIDQKNLICQKVRKINNRFYLIKILAHGSDLVVLAKQLHDDKLIIVRIPPEKSHINSAVSILTLFGYKIEKILDFIDIVNQKMVIHHPIRNISE